jgi:hypothetical protein
MKPEIDGPKIVRIGGRDFRVVESSTLDHDRYMVRHKSRLDIDRRAEETGTAFAQRVFDDALDRGVAFQLLGGLVIPANIRDESWTESLANDTAEFMRSRTAHDDKLTISAMLASLLIGFFADALASSLRSDTSLSANETGERQFPEERPATIS